MAIPVRSLLSLSWICWIPWIAACDPEGPGAAGQLQLGAGVDPGGFTTLAIRVYPEARADFDPSAAIAPPGPEYVQNEALRPVGFFGGALPALQFPFRYRLGEAVGTTPHRSWRMVAWLSRETVPQSAIAPGEVFCTKLFEIESCGLFAGGHCQHTQGVDCTLDQVRK